MSLKIVAAQQVFCVKSKEWYSYIKIEEFHLNALHGAINHKKLGFLRKEYGERQGGNPYESKGALLYMVCDHVVRPTELTSQTLECPGFFVAMLRTRGCTPCAALRLSLPTWGTNKVLTNHICSPSLFIPI